MSETTYVVYGDIGGHYGALTDSLAKDAHMTDLEIPANTVIIQLGDLIHKGPDSDQLVAFVDAVMDVNNGDPSRGTWIQLMGNHESQYVLAHPKSPFQIPEGIWFWNDVIDRDSFLTLLKWWETGSMRSHVIIEDRELGPVLITHAGVSYYFMSMVLGWGFDDQPVTADDLREFSRIVSGMDRIHPLHLAAPGLMITGSMNLAAGFVWAESTREVYASWEGVKMPFQQVHGHSSPMEWSRRRMRSTVPEYISGKINVNRKQHQTSFSWDSSSFFGIDPGFESRAPWPVSPLILHA